MTERLHKLLSLFLHYLSLLCFAGAGGLAAVLALLILQASRLSINNPVNNMVYLHVATCGAALTLLLYIGFTVRSKPKRLREENEGRKGWERLLKERLREGG